MTFWLFTIRGGNPEGVENTVEIIASAIQWKNVSAAFKITYTVQYLHAH